MGKSTLQEKLVALYLRLNGYFVSGFIVHAPIEYQNAAGETRRARTELDILAVRFPFNREPERVVLPSTYLDVSNSHIDIVIGEVKGGLKERLQFNRGLRENPDAIESILGWIGILDDEKTKSIIGSIESILSTQNEPDYSKFSEYIVPKEISKNNIRFRTIIFAPDRPKPSLGQIRYVYGGEIIDFVWRCLCPEESRVDCETKYDYGLWGNYEELVRYFKRVDRKPNSLDKLYVSFTCANSKINNDN